MKQNVSNVLCCPFVFPKWIVCIAVNHKINIFYISLITLLYIISKWELLYFQQHRVLKYLDVQKTSPNKKKMLSVQYKALTVGS